MLVLTRKLKEQIRVGNEITITILRVSGKSVRVGIEAPREVRVVRAELPMLEETIDETEESAEEVVPALVVRAAGRRGPKTDAASSTPRTGSKVNRIHPREAVDAMTPRLGNERRGYGAERVTVVEPSAAPTMRPSATMGPLAMRGLVGRRG
ncbi:MAG: carbon storage regulator [Pirellulales bacterium]|nr:carbon storage regulator [Pirellulales bacterium]